MIRTYEKKMVSIVLLCYKNAEFLDEAIGSILAQTYQNFEVIVADDASNDGSREIIEQWAKKDSRIIPLIHEKNLGMSANQNSGFDLVRGEFVVPMSGDDILLPTKLEKQVRYLQEHPECGLVLSVTQAFDTFTREVLYTLKPAEKPEDWLFNTDFFFSGKKYGSHNNTTTLGRSSYFLASRYDSRLKYKGEVLHAIENYCVASSQQWHAMDEVLSLYRIHPNSATKTASLLRLIGEENAIVYGVAAQRYPSYAKLLWRKYSYVEFVRLFQKAHSERLIGSSDFVRYFHLFGIIKTGYLVLMIFILNIKKSISCLIQR